MLFQCKDFKVDKPCLYSEIRKVMAMLYPNGELFRLDKESTFGESLSDTERKKQTIDKIISEKEIINKMRRESSIK